MNVHKVVYAHLQYVSNNYAKFEYKGIKTFGVQTTQTRHHKSVEDGQTDGVDPLLNLVSLKGHM